MLLAPILLVLTLADLPAVAEDSTGLTEERLTYRVSWAGLTIGRIRMVTRPVTDTRDPGFRRISIAIDSKEGIPFVSLHFRAETEIDSLGTSLAFRSYEQDGDLWIGTEYEYEADRRAVRMEEFETAFPWGPRGTLRRCDTLQLPSADAQDGISLVAFARRIVLVPEAFNVPTVSYGRVGMTMGNAARNRSTVAIDACARPVRVVELTGRLDVKGIFGLKGDYRGWFSDDSAAVPIRAEMKVILGSVVVELESWTRDRWEPPQIE